MLEQIGNTIRFYAFFTSSKQGLTGLTPTIDVYRGTTQVVTAGSATALGGGLYYYDLSGATVTVEEMYTAIFKTTSSSADVQHVPALWVVGKAGIENLDSPLSGILAAVNTVLARLGAITGTGINTVLGFFRALGRKDGGLTPTDMGGNFDNTTDSLEAIRDRGDVAWLTGGGGGSSSSTTLGGGASCTVIEFDQSEKKRLLGTLEATSGNLTIQGQPTVQLFNAKGTLVYGITGINATGFDAGAASSVRVWYDLDTQNPPSGGPIAPGRYTLYFKVTVLASAGGQTEVRQIELPIKVTALG